MVDRPGNKTQAEGGAGRVGWGGVGGSDTSCSTCAGCCPLPVSHVVQQLIWTPIGN